MPHALSSAPSAPAALGAGNAAVKTGVNGEGSEGSASGNAALGAATLSAALTESNTAASVDRGGGSPWVRTSFAATPL